MFTSAICTRLESDVYICHLDQTWIKRLHLPSAPDWVKHWILWSGLDLSQKFTPAICIRLESNIDIWHLYQTWVKHWHLTSGPGLSQTLTSAIWTRLESNIDICHLDRTWIKHSHLPSGPDLSQTFTSAIYTRLESNVYICHLHQTKTFTSTIWTRLVIKDLVSVIIAPKVSRTFYKSHTFRVLELPEWCQMTQNWVWAALSSVAVGAELNVPCIHPAAAKCSHSVPHPACSHSVCKCGLDKMDQDSCCWQTHTQAVWSCYVGCGWRCELVKCCLCPSPVEMMDW